MGQGSKNFYCCCQMFTINSGLYLMAFHCMLHGLYGICLIITTFHKNENFILSYSAVAAAICFVCMGVFVFWTVLYRSWKSAKFCGFVMAVTTLFNLITFILYFVRYINFKANSLLDANLFWRSKNDWVKKGEYPFTLWHTLTAIYVVITLNGLYYTYILCKSTEILKLLGERPNSESVSET